MFAFAEACLNINLQMLVSNTELLMYHNEHSPVNENLINESVGKATEMAIGTMLFGMEYLKGSHHNFAYLINSVYVPLSFAW